jgi:hypothetical protein
LRLVIPEIKSRTQQLVEARTGRVLKELLRELYIDQRRSDAEIAEALDVDRVTVNRWRRDYGITRDPRPPVTI